MVLASDQKSEHFVSLTGRAATLPPHEKRHFASDRRFTSDPPATPLSTPLSTDLREGNLELVGLEGADRVGLELWGVLVVDVLEERSVTSKLERARRAHLCSERRKCARHVHHIEKDTYL